MKMIMASGRIVGGAPKIGMTEGDRYVVSLKGLEGLARCGAARVVYGLSSAGAGYEVWETFVASFDPVSGSISSKVVLDEFYV